MSLKIGNGKVVIQVATNFLSYLAAFWVSCQRGRCPCFLGLEFGVCVLFPDPSKQLNIPRNR